MSKYRVYLQTIASTAIDVEADSKEEAVEAALNEDMPTLCVHCAGWGKEDKNLELGDVWDTSPNLSLDDSVTELEG